MQEGIRGRMDMVDTVMRSLSLWPLCKTTTPCPVNMDMANKSDLAKAPKNTPEGTQQDRKGRAGRMTSHQKTKQTAFSGQKLKMDWVWAVFSASNVI